MRRSNWVASLSRFAGGLIGSIRRARSGAGADRKSPLSFRTMQRRDPAENFAGRVAQLSRHEFDRWQHGTGRQGDEPYCSFVGEYWRVGLGKSRDGRTTFSDEKRRIFVPAWSAAFVSYIFRSAGAGDSFYYHEAHIHYVVKAIRDASAVTTASFVGRDPGAWAPSVGDIIIASRSKVVNYSNVLAAYGAPEVPHGNFIPCHADIVAEVDEPAGVLRTIGGNLGAGTVDMREWALFPDGRLATADDLLCVIQCRM